ncbi:FAD-dependent oxidoreductase [Azohydromonas australica]|uniref:FAD-dependent oxidoreductase n=1 Tax=Azohydromonas australica TaxID=364039 RepID=UPI00041F6634|nr:FAD-dependent oxidoreductase [Azohydromonas australica]
MTVGNVSWDHETDVLVFGSGVAGFSTAIFARKRGLDVLVCEKMPVVGGTTATSGGFAWVPNTLQSKAGGAVDSVENARTYLRHELGEYYRADLVDAFLEAGPEAMATLQDGTDVAFDYVKWPDYHADQVGGVSAGRTHEPRRFDGRLLGKDFELLRPPIRRLMLLGGMSIDKRKVDDFLNPFKSVRGFLRVLGAFGRYALDRTRYSRGTDIGAGNALVARLFLTLRKLQGGLWVSAPLVELISEEGRVVGAVVEHEGRRKRVRARQGVVLATGGFPHNAKMREELGPRHPHDRSVGWEANVGEGINAARRIGGAIDHAVCGPGLWQPSSVLRHPDGSEETILYGYLDRGKPGIIAVDAHGRRFVNESNSYHDIGEAMFRNGVAQGNHFHFICERKFVWKRGLGLIRPFRLSLAPYVKSGYIAMDDTLEGLARKIGVDPAGLLETVRKHNDYARTGVDLEFRRGTNPFNSILLGDPACKPNPNLAPITQGPFVALRMYPSTLGTAIGLAANGHSQVLDASQQPIPGLYACGQDMSHVMRGFYPGGGINIGPAIVFAFVAVRHIGTGQAAQPAAQAAEPAAVA